ncbi:MAG TPA: hypothetical protein VF105_12170 [Gemmatimonadaceae bacterium]
MNDKDKPTVATTTVTATGTAGIAGTATPTIPPPPKRSPGHRGADVKDTVAEMAAKAQEISMEAGSKMAAAMKDVIGAAAGLTGFVIESARDLLQYMVRRGQMTQEEADKLMREVEASHAKRKPSAPPAPSALRPPPRVETPHAPQAAAHTSHATAHVSHAPPAHHAPSPARHTPTKHAAPVKAAAKKPTMKAAKKHPVKAAKSKAKASGKAKRR